ncbi:RING/U-box superfamily protein [Artemisia annua]|uniref:RING/U-box superfamily protein n=1 Tax=Artemisia annua TaxID=35608 RepID=A0A2U1LVQ0_ARTAN|nr:RING/U-box superfamily protein [Artemisia annua]
MDVISNSKDANKKKRVNRSAKLKQSKLDVRREQWLSQVKNKGSKEENKGGVGAKVPVSDMHEGNEGGRGVAIAKLVISAVGEENENEGLLMSDWDSPSNSPTSNMSCSLASNMSNRSVINFAGSSCRSSTSSSGGCGCFYSDMTEEDDGDDGCLDDWEAIADALAAEDVKNECENKTDENENENGVEMSFESETERVKEGVVEDREKVNCRAWRPDDAYRPQGLPNLLKQNSFPMNSDRHYGGGTVWGFKNVGMSLAPLTCPICCEDLDLTDSSFLPCPCGYRLCLFCYKRIFEDNGRCPGCRKQYEQPDQGNANAALKLARSYSMIPRR